MRSRKSVAEKKLTVEEVIENLRVPRIGRTVNGFVISEYSPHGEPPCLRKSIVCTTVDELATHIRNWAEIPKDYEDEEDED